MLSFKQNTDAFKKQIEQCLTPSIPDTVELLEVDTQLKRAKIEASIRIFKYIRMAYPAQKLFPREKIKFFFNDSSCQITTIGNCSLSLLSQILEVFIHKLHLKKKKREKKARREKQASRGLRKAIIEETRDLLEEEISKVFPGKFKLEVSLRKGYFFFLALKREKELLFFKDKGPLELLQSKELEEKIHSPCANINMNTDKGGTRVEISYAPIVVEEKEDKEELLAEALSALSH